MTNAPGLSKFNSYLPEIRLETFCSWLLHHFIDVMRLQKKNAQIDEKRAVDKSLLLATRRFTSAKRSLFTVACNIYEKAHSVWLPLPGIEFILLLLLPQSFFIYSIMKWAPIMMLNRVKKDNFTFRNESNNFK